MIRFLTIRQTAALGLLSEHRLRLLVAAGECPGIKAGNRFLVDVEELEKKLRELSMQAVRKEEEK